MKLFLINEDADCVDIDVNDQLKWYDEESVPFIVTENFENIYYGKRGCTHESIIGDLSFSLRGNPNREQILTELGSRSSCYGRIWLDEEIIAFYDIPSPQDMIKIVALISQKYNVSNFLLDTNTFHENGVSKLTLLQEYINGGKTETRDVNRDDIIHLMDPTEKVKTPQMQAYLKDRTQNQSNKLTNKENGKEMSRVEYNTLRRPYSESKKVSEGELEDKYNELLRKRVWDTERFKRSKELHTRGTPEEKKIEYGDYLKNRYDNLKKKLGNLPEVEYNYYVKKENKMRKQLVLSESELHNFINEKAKEIVNEMKYGTIYRITKKCVDESLNETNNGENQLRETIRRLIRETYC